ncbi:MAG: cysteine desulfurase [Candidatus Methanomethylicota archaeon]|uniref:Cysteine desulfurase n=1 Tax=Thermoproteota archaeon TaxID=2056631 RepID=A0A497EZG6_9CREN|nr:MAG: cysteine desulfurase [Candidatus Verstraetearchaeota archaeon]
MLNISKIRKDFPILSTEINGHKLIYFDNAASSQKPVQVIEAIKRFYLEEYANVHRGVHTLSQKASELYDEAREVVGKFIGAKSNEVVFVKNTSEAINLVAYTWGLRNLDEGDEVLITLMEHHSNITPWVTLSNFKRFKVKFSSIKPDGTLDYEDLEKKISNKTKIVAMVHMSNVTGTINDVKRIIKLAHDHGALVLVDGAQSVPHMPVNVKNLQCDFLAFSGHKMLGPTGIGVLYVSEKILESIEPTISGGGTIRNVKWDAKENTCTIDWTPTPQKLEAGTPNIAGAIGLAEAVKYLEKIGMKNVRKHEEELTRYTLKRFEELEKTVIYGPLSPENRGGIITFNIGKLNPHQVALILDQYGIAVRSGFHCAEPLHHMLGASKGTVRASYYIYNSIEEVDRMVEIIKKIEEIA